MRGTLCSVVYNGMLLRKCSAVLHSVGPRTHAKWSYPATRDYTLYGSTHMRKNSTFIESEDCSSGCLGWEASARIAND